MGEMTSKGKHEIPSNIARMGLDPGIKRSFINWATSSVTVIPYDLMRQFHNLNRYKMSSIQYLMLRTITLEMVFINCQYMTTIHHHTHTPE